MDSLSQTPPKSAYRMDLQILRAVAIILVMLFHLGIPHVTGGFIGVDIFFVLSGYFVTQTFFSAAAPTFKSRALLFYDRRMRRILPAALFTCLAVLTAAPFLLAPVEIKELVSQTLASALGYANILFSNDKSYFVDSLFRPMLHYWSLAVEYQYYLAFPAMVFLAGKRRWVAPFILLSSFVACLVSSYDSPESAFYTMPMRIWEFMLGYYAFQLQGNRRLIKNGKIFRVAVPAGALIAILLCALVITPKMAFPGWVAAIPALAVFILLLYGFGESGKFIKPAARMLAGIGTISFSLYLWHYPVIWLFTYYPFAYSAKPELAQVPAILALTLAAALFSYFLVETPFRNPGRVSGKVFYLSIAGGFLILFSLSAFYYNENYRLRDYSAVQQKAIDAVEDRLPYRCDKKKHSLEGGYASCLIAGTDTKPRKIVLLAGNSHADSIKPVFMDRAREAGVSLYLQRKNCNPGQDDCDAAYFLDEIRRRNVTDFVFHGLIKNGKTYDDLDRMIAALKGSGVRVHIIDPTPMFEISVPGNLYTGDGKNRVTRNDYREKNKEYFLWKKKREGLRNVRFYSVESLLCPESDCIEMNKDHVLYFDNHHLTVSGSRLLRPVVDEIYR